MKRILFTFIGILVFGVLNAQTERLYLFEEFENANIYMKTGEIVQSPINYDVKRGKVYFKNGSDLMELTNLYQIDSLKVNERIFITKGNDINEKFLTSSGEIYVLWRINEIHEGYKGAFGVSQIPSRTIKLSSFYDVSGNGSQGQFDGSNSTNGNYSRTSNDVWRKKSQNTYYFEKNGKSYAVSKMSQLQKAFPEKKKQIKDFAKQYDLNFDTAEKAVILIAYVMALD